MTPREFDLRNGDFTLSLNEQIRIVGYKFFSLKKTKDRDYLLTVESGDQLTILDMYNALIEKMQQDGKEWQIFGDKFVINSVAKNNNDILHVSMTYVKHYQKLYRPKELRKS